MYPLGLELTTPQTVQLPTDPHPSRPGGLLQLELRPPPCPTWTPWPFAAVTPKPWPRPSADSLQTPPDTTTGFHQVWSKIAILYFLMIYTDSLRDQHSLEHRLNCVGDHIRDQLSAQHNSSKSASDSSNSDYQTMEELVPNGHHHQQSATLWNQRDPHNLLNPVTTMSR